MNYTCRVCRLEDPSMKMISLRDKDNWDRLVKITSLKVLIHDTFPQQICKDCNRILELCHNFIAEAEESDRLFREEELAREAKRGIFEAEDPWEFMYIDDDDDTIEARSPSVKKFPTYKGKEEKAISSEVVSSTVSLTFFTCDECEINFPTEIQMWSHKENVHDLKLHCNTCNEVFYELKSWNIHLISHPQEFKCEECRMTFIKNCEYESHRILHQIKAQTQQRTLPFQGNSFPELPIPTISFSSPNTTLPFYNPKVSGPAQPAQRTLATLQNNSEWNRPIRNVHNNQIYTNLVQLTK